MTGYQTLRSTLIVVAVLGLIYLFALTINVWIVLMIAILASSSLRPAIMRLHRNYKLPLPLAIFIVYGTMAFITIAMLVAVLPPVVNQFAAYLQNDDRLANRIIVAQSWVERFFSQNTGSEVELDIDPQAIRDSVRTFVTDIRTSFPTLISDISNFLGDFILIIVMGIYWITSRERAEQFLVDFVPLSRQGQARAILDEIEYGLGAYVRGIVLVSIIVGLLCFTALTLLRAPGAATISFIYGLATAIPIIGGLIGVVAGTGLALLSSPSAAVEVFVVTFLIQQIENYFLSPRIMAKSSAFDEILVIVFIAMGFRLNGITGALIAIPVAGTVAIIMKHLVFEPRKAQVTPVRVEGGILLQSQDLSEPQPPIIVKPPPH